jgi:hypothetical protein
MATHTAGPWEGLYDDEDEVPEMHGPHGHVITEDGSFELAVVWANEVGLDVAKANAFLMASAPDLLEALEKLASAVLMLVTGNESPGLTAAFNAAQAAIAKAKGEVAAARQQVSS